MPYPVALAIAAAASAAGTGMQLAAQNQAQNAVARQRRQELQRQGEYQKKANVAVADSLAQAGRDTAEEQINAGAARREGEYAKLDAAAPPAVTAPVPANRTVSSPLATAQTNQQAATAAWNRILSGAQARAGGYADWGLEQNIKNRRANEQIGTASDFARHSAAVNQMELEQASHAGDNLAGWGSAVGALGNVAAAYGAGAPGKGDSGAQLQLGDVAPVEVGSMGAGTPGLVDYSGRPLAPRVPLFTDWNRIIGGT